MNTRLKSKKRLINTLCRISDTAEMEQALDAILTSKEREEVENRLLIFKLLMEGVPQREIAAQLGVGIATVTRGANAMKRISTETIKRFFEE